MNSPSIEGLVHMAVLPLLPLLPLLGLLVLASTGCGGGDAPGDAGNGSDHRQLYVDLVRFLRAEGN